VDELVRREAGGSEGFGAEGPDGSYPGEAGELAPEVGEVEPEEWGFGGVVDGGALLAGEEGWVADEEGGVGAGEHGGEISGKVDEGGVGVVEVLEQYAGVGDGAAAGGVGRDGADLFEGFVGGEPVGIFDEE